MNDLAALPMSFWRELVLKLECSFMGLTGNLLGWNLRVEVGWD